MDPWIPAGSYDITASKQIGGYFMSVTESVEILADQTTSIDLYLEPPPQYVRRVTVSGTMHIVDDEPPAEDDEYLDYNIYEAVTLDIFDRDALIIVPAQCAGGEVRVEMRFNLHLSEADDMTVIVNWVNEHGHNVHVWLFEGTDCSTDDLEEYGRWQDGENPPSVPPGTYTWGEMYLENDEVDSPDSVTINITWTNEQATFPDP